MSGDDERAREFEERLRDGQGALSTAATDPVTSEDVTIEASLKLLR